MRPFAKDNQPVVIKGRRKSKLAAPKTKSASAQVKRKGRNVRRKQNDGADDLSKDGCQFVPVRRKPLGEYMKLEVPLASPSPSAQGMRMSYAAAVQTESGVKVMISPRLKKSNKTGKAGKVNKMAADTKFRIFDEQPKSHIVRVDAKAFRTDNEQAKSRLKGYKIKKSVAQKASKTQLTLPTRNDLNDAEIIALELKFKRLKCNAAGTAKIAAVQTARNLNSIQGNSLAASIGGQRVKQFNKAATPSFSDSVSYLGFHLERLQRILKKQTFPAIHIQSSEPMKIPQFDDIHFKYLEETALLTQNRTMLRLWLNSDQLIY